VDAIYLSLAAGVALGLASTLHCAGMCGGIVTSLTLCCDTSTKRPYVGVLIVTNLGRITAYALAGAAVGAGGASLIGWLDREAAYRLLQWGGAVALMWIGLSTAGLLPAPTGIDRLLTPVTNRLSRLPSALGRYGALPFFSGLAWGMMPCAMVYGALFTAMLAGSAAGGTAVMLGFGAGTLPGLTITALGIRSLVRADMRRGLRGALGLAITCLGFATVWIPHAELAALCR